jgi:para-aminobenzoate synthetase component 1
MSGQAISLSASTCQCTRYCKKIPLTPDLTALNEVFAGLENPAILGGNVAKAEADGFSYWAAEPVEVLEIPADQPDPLGTLHRTLDRYRLEEADRPDLPSAMFCCGWIGFFSYDLGRFIEPVPSVATDDLHMPLVRLAFYDRLIAYDPRQRTVWLMALHMPNDLEGPQEKLDHLEGLLDQSAHVHVAPPCPADIEGLDLTGVRSNMTQAQYRTAFERIKRHITDGDVYQINLSQRFSLPFSARPIDLFHWQNAFNPCAYAAYIDAPPFGIVSASPEMFLTLSQGEIRTQPIKGTRPRIAKTSAWARQTNERSYRDLAASEKDQAELAMIVDLERNDLARVCIPGTRRVLMPRTIETCPTVFHAVAVISGRLRSDVGFCDVLRAAFPGGSITGAPKIRAMEIIDRNEPTARGLYTGSIGFIGIDGTACLNIAIRTIIIADQTAYVQVGGGIVADSDPRVEYDETLTKARALIAGIEKTEARSQK